jgi:hypothetical protein
MANRIPTFIDTANERISEIPSGDALDLTGGSLLADGIETDTLTVNGVLYAPYDDTALEVRLDSEHAWNVAEHAAEVTARGNADTALGSRLDSEHAWNVTEHTNLLGQVTTSIDSEHAWNVTQHNELQTDINLEALTRSNEDAALSDALVAEQTARSNADTALNDKLDSEHAWNVAEHAAEVTARGNADTALGARLDSDYAWNVVEHAALQSLLDNLTTDSVAEGIENLYYTDSRVEDKILSTVDSAYVELMYSKIDVFRDSNFVTEIVDSAYVELMYSKIDVFRDSNFVTEIVDSNYVNLRVDMIDSSTIITLIDSALTAGIISLDASPSGGASDDF